MPRWFTQGPRFVETVTSGEVVTILEARAELPRESPCRTPPNACWVDMVREVSSFSRSGTSTLAAAWLREPGALIATPWTSRPEQRRVVHEFVGPCRTRWPPTH